MKKSFKAAMILVAVLLLIMAVTFYRAYSAYRVFKLLSAIEENITGTTETETEDTAGQPAVKEAVTLPKTRYTFLIYGIDAGEWVNGTFRPGPARADTIILLRLDFAARKASMLSIPRDTLVEIPGRPGTDKINHSHAFGGARLLQQTVENFTGVTADYYIQVNYLVFKEIVDSMGGIAFEVDRRINAAGHRLEPGWQVLNGDQAFALVSFRREAMGDIARVERQQRFAMAVAKEARQQPAPKLLPIVYSCWKHIKTNLTLTEAIELAASIHLFNENNLVREIVPGWFYNRDGISYWRADAGELQKIIDLLFNTELPMARLEPL